MASTLAYFGQLRFHGASALAGRKDRSLGPERRSTRRRVTDKRYLWLGRSHE